MSCFRVSSRPAGLEMGTSASMMARADAVVLVIGTPVDEFLGPSMRVFERAVDQIAPHLADGALVVMRSTVYPGTTEYVTAAFEDRGLRVDVAFCPERVAEGHALEELRSLPQIIGADDPVAGDRAEALFRHLTSNTIRTTTKEAELTKLFTNTWRYMKFAIANQFFAIADRAGVDYTNVLRALREDYPRAADLPGPGFAAGPCLFKDTMQLAAFSRTTSRWARRPCRSTRACPPTSSRRWSGATAACAAGPWASWAWRSRRSRMTSDAIAQLQAAQAAGLEAVRRCCARTPTCDDPGLVSLNECSN